MNNRRYGSLWEPAFFGLTSSDKEIYLEPIYLLMYWMGFTHTEAYGLPVWERNWFIERLNKELKQQQDSEHAQTRAAHHNDPETRAFQGRTRTHTPAKLRRFT
mgnify:CR=1 FL=1